MQPTPFQKNTADAVVRAFSDTRGTCRYLVADEVGLGKTIVAQQVMRQMLHKKDGALKVIYVSSNLAIAKQNAPKLLAFLKGPEQQKAIAKVDRLTLLLTARSPSSKKIHLYPLTPTTSIPFRGRRGSIGTIRERVLIMQLLALLVNPFGRRSKNMQLWDWLPTRITDKKFRELRTRWRGEIPTSWFKKQGQEEFRGNAKPETLEQIARSNKDIMRKVKPRQIDDFARSVLKTFDVKTPGELFLCSHGKKASVPTRDQIKQLRNALAMFGISVVKPDLIIFDEFQRFTDLLENDHPKQSLELIKAIRGEKSLRKKNVITTKDPKLILLSATPYRMLASANGSASRDHYESFYKLIEFLYGGIDSDSARGKRNKLQELFRGRLKFLTAKSHTESDESGARDAANENKKDIESILRKVMCRTERATYAKQAEATYQPIKSLVNKYDAAMFKLFSNVVEEGRKSGITAYWDSIPFPCQTMGKHYVATKYLDFPPRVSRNLKLAKNGQLPNEMPHTKMRALIEQDEGLALADPKRLVLPWMAPSLPWWKLGGAWTNEEDRPQKLLMFSRFVAVPNAVSVVLSSLTEREALKYHNVNLKKIAQIKPIRKHKTGNNAQLFRPSLFGILLTDPLKFIDDTGQRSSKLQVLRKARSHLRNHFNKLKGNEKRILFGKKAKFPQFMRDRRAHKLDSISFWADATFIDANSNLYRQRKKNIKKVITDAFYNAGFYGGIHGYSQNVINSFDAEGECVRRLPIILDKKLLGSLAEIAVGSPANILCRSLLRSGFGEIDITHITKEVWDQLTEISSKCQPFFNNLFFVNKTLTGRRRIPVWKRLVNLCLDGNLESVLDEHFWVYSKINGLDDPGEERFKKLLKHVYEIFSVQMGGSRILETDNRGDDFNIRAHVARPFSEFTAEKDSKGHKTGGGKTAKERLKDRFNSPFWPHVLTTTSAGQEGLDFHVWCNSVVHWDVRTSPIDMEQREGRVQRFAGIGVRREIANVCGVSMWKDLKHKKSPWKQLENLATSKEHKKTPMHPWWTFNGSHPNTYFFDIQFTQQLLRYNRVRQQQMVYRLALGQSNQHALVNILSDDEKFDRAKIEEYSLNLKPTRDATL